MKHIKKLILTELTNFMKENNINTLYELFVKSHFYNIVKDYIININIKNEKLNIEFNFGEKLIVQLENKFNKLYLTGHLIKNKDVFEIASFNPETFKEENIKHNTSINNFLYYINKRLVLYYNKYDCNKITKIYNLNIISKFINDNKIKNNISISQHNLINDNINTIKEDCKDLVNNSPDYIETYNKFIKLQKTHSTTKEINFYNDLFLTSKEIINVFLDCFNNITYTEKQKNTYDESKKYNIQIFINGYNLAKYTKKELYNLLYNNNKVNINIYFNQKNKVINILSIEKIIKEKKELFNILSLLFDIKYYNSNFNCIV